ncbi:OLC1v1022007C1 [Oldenlandia corymbosa var. corymbosa]|uniref:OLC1v1022007C1 n=1 Tax=Oldenlandia corymbosa var. corymbosa TaxID=529605 RepID=A0AAV1BX34_OLDCO|nr:OLC1v1022007C1 [Oldenlandia corymbosa var. corymbosa]
MEPRDDPRRQVQPPSPLPSSSSSYLLKDISNFKTPKNPSKIPRTPSTKSDAKFFTAQKATPSSMASRRKMSAAAPTRSKAARRLKDFELEQSKSARRNQVTKEKSLKSLSKSLSVWLNFLFENPKSCGCDVSRFTGEFDRDGSHSSQGDKECSAKGKREAGPGRGVKVGVDGPWRGPKRQRDMKWKGNSESRDPLHLGLKTSLKDICSFDDLKERMRAYLSLDSCNEIFDTMTQVAKNIDDGRLNMRAHCPIVTDVGMKERSLGILMSYNPVWLRIGLFVILGGDLLLPTAQVNSEQEMTFLRMVIEKHFFSHAELAKIFAYNKMVDGLYRPGYFEKLGSVILKRFLLLVLVLDRAKSQSSLPLKYGIDGRDGGSPLLFSSQSNIKSSRQVISEFLTSDIMHGEGNLLAHLTIVGYKVTYQQSPLVEYSFKVTELYEDLQDGIRLCRAIQLLQHDSSILLKLVVPSDTHKKSLVNCGVAIQYLKQAGVPLHDEDGTLITEEDIANGEKELVLSLLWNMFVHLQLPLLINKKLLSMEISKIRGVIVEHSSSCTTLEMLLNWIQAVGESYELKVENFSSLVDGKAMWCLLDYYFRKEHSSSFSSKDPDETNKVISLVSTSEYADAVHNFILSQKLTLLLGNFPEVLQVSDLLEYNSACNDRSVIILLVFLSFQLLVKRNMDQLNFHKLLGPDIQTPERKHPSTQLSFLHSPTVLNPEDASRSFKAIMTWWQDMAQMNNRCNPKTATAIQQCSLITRKASNIERENAAKMIQSHFRRLLEFRKYMKMRKATYLLQVAVRAWLAAKLRSSKHFSGPNSQTSFFCTVKNPENCRGYMALMVDRHDFVNLRTSVLVIQHAVRMWISRRRQKESRLLQDLTMAATVIQACIRGTNVRSQYTQMVANFHQDVLYSLHSQAALIIQSSWRKFIVRKSLQEKHFAATKIQSQFRGFQMRKSLEEQKEAVLKIQSIFRCLRCKKDFQRYMRIHSSVIVIQSHFRRWDAQRRYHVLRCHAVMIQSQHFFIQFSRHNEAAIRIQTDFRCMKQCKAYSSQRFAAIQIQSFVRGYITRKRLLGSSFCHKISNNDFSNRNFKGKRIVQSVLKLQQWWRKVLLLKMTKSAITIQSYYRQWMARKRASRERQRIVVIQSYWKGYLARKDSKGQLKDLRVKVQKTAANIDNSMRLINRLLAALAELLSMRSISGILHTCATLDVTTEHSQRCCEELVAAGAVGTLLKLIQSVSRSIPDQEVLKHALSTLRNLARYPHLTEVLIDTHGFVQTILWELIRNKEEGYFIACDLLKKICSNKKGSEAMQSYPPLIKRLHTLVDDLKKKAGNDKRNVRSSVSREHADRRLKEAVELIELIRKR